MTTINNTPKWQIAAFKHARYAIIETDILSFTLALSNALKHREDPKFEGCLVKPFKGNLLTTKEAITIEELLSLK